MLLRFGCENYRSIGEYQEVLFTPSSSKDDGSYLFAPEAIREKVLPIIALYGANASGKTNLLKALRISISGILYSASSDFKEARFPKFKLDKDLAESPSTFDIDFIFENKHYHYGFSVNSDEVTAEWLYVFSYASRMSRSILFYRDKSSDDEEYYFGKNLKGKNKSISEITGESSLFLSVAAKSKHELFQGISKYFKENYNFRFNSELSENQIGKKISENRLEEEISHFLSLIDIGTSQLEVSKVEIDEEQKRFRSTFQSALLSSLPEKDIDFNFPSDDHEYVIDLHRARDDGRDMVFKYREESLGTRALISLLASVFRVLRNGGVFVVDELESSLHTLLSLKVVDLFNNKKTNPSGAQLIFTTHETQLLNFDGVRKDEVWLTEKCGDGSTHVSPLSDYAITKRTNIRNGYLEGRFGAIPFLGAMEGFCLPEVEDVEKNL